MCILALIRELRCDGQQGWFFSHHLSLFMMVSSLWHSKHCCFERAVTNSTWQVYGIIIPLTTKPKKSQCWPICSSLPGVDRLFYFVYFITTRLITCHSFPWSEPNWWHCYFWYLAVGQSSIELPTLWDSYIRLVILWPSRRHSGGGVPCSLVGVERGALAPPPSEKPYRLSQLIWAFTWRYDLVEYRIRWVVNPPPLYIGLIPL